MYIDSADKCPYRIDGSDCSCLNEMCKEVLYGGCIHRLRADCKYLKGLIEESIHVIERDVIIDGHISDLLYRMKAAL